MTARETTVNLVGKTRSAVEKESELQSEQALSCSTDLSVLFY